MVNLNVATKVRASQEGSLGITSHAPGNAKECEGMNPLPSELPFWELESQWTPEYLDGNCRGQNPLD